jgi:hypothetical protein
MAMSHSHLDALWWLNDHSGKYVTVAVQVDVGSHSESMVSARGTLEHWSDDRRSPGVTDALMVAAGTELSGWYQVGKLSLDLTRIDDSVASFQIRDGAVMNPATAALAAAREEATIPYEELRIELDSRVALHITVTERVA